MKSSPAPATLLTTQLETLDREGYIVVPDVLDGPWVSRLLVAFEHAPRHADGTQHVRLDERTPELASWRALEQHPIIVAAATHVLGRPFVTDVHGRNPLPGFGQQGLHADWRPRAEPLPYFVLTQSGSWTPSSPTTGPHL